MLFNIYSLDYYVSNLGMVEVGKKKDLILANRNPLTDVANTRDLRGVMLHHPSTAM